MSGFAGKSDPFLVAAFLQRYLEDERRSATKSLSFYQGLYPGHEELIAREFRALDTETEPTDGSESSSSQRLGRFHIERQIGRGGQGVVYEATDTRLHRRVALKVLSDHRGWFPEARERFKREAEAASKIDHPNICAVHESGEAGGQLYIAMRYVEGESLAKRIDSWRENRHPSDANDTTTQPSSRTGIAAVLTLIQKVARGLHKAHEAGLVHRDIKPGNIMITVDEEPLILDFGLARDELSDSDTLTHDGDLLGTPAYMSPEQLMAQRVPLDRRTDVYSLGATLYECLTLQRPFEAPTRADLYQEILLHDPPSATSLNRQIPRDLEVVLQTAMEKDRNRRYQTALSFAEDIERFLSHEPVLAKPPGLGYRTKKFVERYRVQVIAVALVFAVLLVGIASTTFLWATAQNNLDRFNLLAGIERLRQAEDAEASIYPPWPENIPKLKNWIAETAEPTNGDLIEVAEEVETLQARVSLSDTERVLLGALEGHVEKLRAFLHPNHCTDPESCDHDDPARLSQAREGKMWANIVREISIDAHAGAWETAHLAIKASDRYALDGLQPQLGLVPIGENPDTGLWEFYHLRSAWDPDSGVLPADIPIPTRGPDGRIPVMEETGIIFVLIPGGWFASPRPALESRNLLPYFLASHELTIGQWERLSGSASPSHRGPQEINYGTLTTGAHPVEMVSLTMCSDLLARHGLHVPFESQWEHAVRGTESESRQTRNPHRRVSTL